MVKSSRPAERQLPLFLITSGTISGEKWDTKLSSGHSIRSFRLKIRVNGSLVWEVNCLIKSVAILRVRVFEEK